MPALRYTTWPLGHDAIAELVWPELAPGLSVAQIVVRFGMPPRTPTFDQSVALVGSIIPDHCCACARIGAIKTSATSPTPGFQEALLMKRNPFFMTALLRFEIVNILGLEVDEERLAPGSAVLLPEGTRGRAGHILHLFCTLAA